METMRRHFHILFIFNIFALIGVCGSFAESAKNSSVVPSVTVSVPPRAAVQDHPYPIQCQIQWQGNPAEYSVLPAQVDPVDWASLQVVSTETWAKDGVVGVTQTIELLPTSVGDHTLGPIRIPYLAIAPGNTAALAADPATIFKTESVAIQVTADHGRSGWLQGCLAGLAFAALAAAAAYQWKRKRRRTSNEAAVSPQEEIQALLHLARRHRLDGDYYSFYRTLTQAAERLSGLHRADEEISALSPVLKRRAADAGYRGIRPNDDEMDGDIKEVERALARWLTLPAPPAK